MRWFLYLKDDHDKFENEQYIDLIWFWDNVYNSDDCKNIDRGMVQDVTIPIFWKDIKSKLPYLSRKEKQPSWRSKSIDLVSFLTELNKTNEISDMRYRMWQHVLNHFDVMETRDIDSNNKMFFFTERTERKKYDQHSIIVAKEMMDWYHNFNFYKWEWSPVAEPIGRIEDIVIDWVKCKTYGAYSTTMRNLMFWDTDFFRKNKRFFQKWQYTVIKNLWHITVFTAKRRMGKSYLLSFLAAREITKQRVSEKPVKVLFISQSENSLWDVKDYLNSMGDTLKGVYEHIKKENSIFFYQIDPDGSRKLNGVIKFLTAWWVDPGIGKFADLIIIDEANKIDERIYQNVLPIVTNEWARLICASTLYEDSPIDHWFYVLLNDAEKETFKRWDPDEFIRDKWFEFWLDKWIDNVNLKDVTKKLKKEMRYSGMRFNWDQNEIMDEEDKAFEKKLLGRNPAAYYAQYWGVYQEEGKVLNYSHCIWETMTGVDKYEYVVIAYDPARQRDWAAVIFSWYKEWKIYDFDEVFLEWDYTKQIEDFVKLKEKYKALTNNEVYTVIDRTWVWMVLFDIISLYWVSFDLWVYSSTGTKVTKTGNWERTVGKEYLVELTQKIISDWNVVFDKKLVNTFEEMNNYKRYEHQRWSGYEAAAGHDDFVSAQLIKNYFIYDYKWAKYEILKTDINKKTQLSDEDITKRYKQQKIDDEENQRQLDRQKAYLNLYNNFIL